MSGKLELAAQRWGKRFPWLRLEHWHSIYFRILGMGLLLIVLLSLSAVALFWKSYNDMVLQQLDQRGQEIAGHMALAGANYILTEDVYNLYELVSQTASSSEDVRYILVLDNKGRILAHTFKNGIPKNLVWDITGFTLPKKSVFNSNEGPIHDLMAPIEHGAIGYVRVGMTEARMRGAIFQQVRIVLLAIFLICLVAALLSSRISRLIIRPLRQLCRVADAIRTGNRQIRADLCGDTEIDKLASGFNDMTASLLQANKEKEDLLKELQAKEALRGTLITKLMTAQEDERKRISREFHDETSQALTSLMLTMRALSANAQNEEQKEALLLGRDVAADILNKVRNLAVELRPPELDDLGLGAAITQYSNKFAADHNLKLDLQISGEEEQVDGRIAVALYRIVQEGFSNIAQHSGADLVMLRIEFKQAEIAVTLADNGKGISDYDLLQAKRKRRLGLYGMQERVELLQGRMEIRESSLGGAELYIVIPQAKADAQAKD
jgi:signal transduction histidine kinase